MWSRMSLAARQLSTSAVSNGRKVRKLKVEREMKRIRLTSRKPWIFDPVVPTSPLAKTEHPVNRFQEEEAVLTSKIQEQSACDAPHDVNDFPGQQNPYLGQDAMCILCPRRYSVPITPSWKNPKLLAQFVSPHSGLVYKKHITGLCQDMQDRVEKQVKIAQASGRRTKKQLCYF